MLAGYASSSSPSPFPPLSPPPSSKRRQLSLIDVDDGPRVANDDGNDGKTSRIEEGGGGGGIGAKAHRRNVAIVTKSGRNDGDDGNDYDGTRMQRALRISVAKSEGGGGVTMPCADTTKPATAPAMTI